MKKNTLTGIIGTAALATVLGLTSRADAASITPEEPLERETSEITITPHAGIALRLLGQSEALERQVDKDAREVYEPAMNGFSDWLQLGDMMPYLSVGVDVDPFGELTDLGARLAFGAEFNFSSSNIFGEHGIHKTFDAKVMDGKVHLGPTPTTFSQSLDRKSVV